jgi:hypothetical protein
VSAVLAAVGEGRIRPSEAGVVMGLIEACRRNLASGSLAPGAPSVADIRISLTKRPKSHGYFLKKSLWPGGQASNVFVPPE